MSARKIVTAANAVQESLRDRSELINGPTKAVRDALARVGQHIESGGVALDNQEDRTLDLSRASPRKVVRIAWEAWQEKLLKEDMTRLGTRRDSTWGQAGN